MSGPRAHAPAPLVTVGLPVKDGERYLEDAIASVLSQSVRDLELVITDNASTDRTPEICRAAAARDPRVRYLPNERDLGAAPNFDRALSHARGRYFRWQAHDDVCAPGYLEGVVGVLEERPQVVLCQAAAWPIDASGAPMRPDLEGRPFTEARAALAHAGLADPPRTLDDARPEVRFRETLLLTHRCYEAFGLTRTSVLRTTSGMQGFYGGDQALLSELVLRGRVVELPAFQFHRRFHQGTSTEIGAGPDRDMWIDTSATVRGGPPALRFVRAFRRAVESAPLNPRQRVACRLAIARWCVAPARWRELARKLRRR